MKSFLGAYKKFFIALAVVSAVVVSLFYQALKPKKTLPIYQPNQVDVSLVADSLQHVKKYHKIADFSLVNQWGDTITQEDFTGKIYVADFFFTTCLTICPVMSDHMSELQQAFAQDEQVLFLSHTVTPEIDSVPVMRAYAEKKGAIPGKWHLVTGDKKKLYELARKSYLVVKTDGDGGPFDMIHTENFVLVDSKKQIRGYYDGTSAEAMEQLKADILLLKELEKEASTPRN